MKTPFRLLTLLLLAGLLTRLPAADRFDRTKAHIDALLSHRLKPEALPAKPANPFLFSAPGATLLATPGGTGPTTPVIPEPAVNALLDDDQILAFCVSRLRITGQVQRGGRTLLLINSNAYSESDLVPVRGSADVVYYVKIVRIAPGEVVFGYNEVVVSVPLRT